MASEIARLRSSTKESFASSASVRTAPRMSSKICSSVSERGLSAVTKTWSAPSSTARSIGARFVRSRSPPQPKTTIKRPGVTSRSIAQAWLRASSVWA